MNVSIEIDDDLFHEMNAATMINDDDMNVLFQSFLEAGIKKYLKPDAPLIISVKSTAPVSPVANNSEDNNFAKAIRKIPSWASKPNQINHKIIKAFFISAENHNGTAILSEMKLLCNDANNPELYVEGKFNNNYPQMKTDKGNSHGKIFEDNGNDVWLWKEIEPTLLQYKNYFI